jgi:transposase
MLADEVDFMVGVDPHRDRNAVAFVRSPSGRVVFEAAAAASSDGYREVLRLAEQHAPGRRVFAIEGTGSYGKGLARFLLEQGERVVEVGRVKRDRRSGAKSDPLDAIRAARSALAADRPAQPRSGGQREALRALTVAREGALNAKRAGLCQLRDLILTAPEALRDELRSLSRARLLTRLGSVRPNLHRDPELRGTLLAMRAVARRLKQLTLEERELKQEIERLVDELAPALLTEPGIGPVSAAQLIISWSHPGRIPTEAAFARLAGAAPIPASSGQTCRYRLDRGGDRQLNRALHTIILTRRNHHAPTRAYITRRVSQGKTKREAIRCLKRYLARHLYRLLQGAPIAT